MAAMYNIVEDDCPPLPSDISDVRTKLVELNDIHGLTLYIGFFGFLKTLLQKEPY
jgi:hypothetical protein